MKEWKRLKLSDLSSNKDSIVSGPFGSNLKVSDYKRTGIPILRLQNVGSGYFINKDIKFISSEKAESLKYHSFEPGDLVLAKLGIPIGKTCIVPSNFSSGIIVADVVRIRPDRKIVDYKFLEYFLNTDLVTSQLTKNIKGATRPRVNLSDVRNIEVFLPPIPEQQRIVSILDRAFEAIDRARAIAEQNLKNAKELFESYLQKAFDNKGENWETKKLGEVYDVRDGTHDSPKYYSTGYPLVTSKNLKNSKLNFDKVKFISEDDYNKINKRSKVDVGDILLAMIGTIGNPVVITKEPNFAIKNVALFKGNTNANSYFLKYYLESKQSAKKMLKDAKGTTQKFVGLGYLRSFPIAIPPLEKQNSIVNSLDSFSFKTERLQSQYEMKIENLEELRKTILHKAFSGQL